MNRGRRPRHFICTRRASQLFGHVKGAFTGAEKDYDGIAVEADKGTLFIDEIGSASKAVQAMLLTIIETKTIRPVGADADAYREVDVRIVTASLAGPDRLKDVIRPDLFYRVADYCIPLPPLRSRAEDIPALALYFLRAANELRVGMPPLTKIAKPALRRLEQHRWPGNLRELNHVIRSAVVRSRESENESVLKEQWVRISEPSAETHIGMPFNASTAWREVQAEFARRWMEAAIQASGGRTKASQQLAIDHKTLKKYVDGQHESTR